MRNRTVIEIVEQSREGKTIGPFKDEQRIKFVRTIRKISIDWKIRLGLAHLPLEFVESGKYVQLYANRVTGVVPIGDYDVTIIPKYLSGEETHYSNWNAALLKMLDYSGSHRFITMNMVSAQQSETASFIDLLAQSYINALGNAITAGVPRTYTGRNASLSTLRGRLDVNRLYPAILINPSKVPSLFDEYTPNSAITRLLKWAALEFVQLVSKGKLANELQYLASLMPGIPPNVPGMLMLDRMQVSAQFRHCEPALNIATWLARHKGGQPGQGVAQFPGILLDSAMVFEDFVIALLKSVCKDSDWIYRRNIELLAEQITGSRSLNTEPDGQIIFDNDECAVIDAKYKLWKQKPQVENVYQVMAGARVLSAKKAVLIYPSPQRNHFGPFHWSLKGDGLPSQLSAIFLDPISITVSDGFRDIKNQLQSDLEHIRQMQD